ncbi:hypothetical protein DFJ43DRAFT_1042426 [Lentinula guzmanii]|uniref:Uncharacterized protein n=1 Tax=Lentinula guzmanii TaxID=2804957 RepID=A0AA38JCZ0_9AGAR|nr:hypothetical protein DFJ43DRAFT_1042426 [Lentinula guzmanii]
MRDTYARPVLKYLRNSEGAASVFAWPKDIGEMREDEVFARGLHNDLNHPHFGFEKDPIQRRFGDPLAERLEHCLIQSAPFSGELSSNEPVGSIERFVAYRISDHTHLLLDSAYEDLECQISTSLLTNPDFDPSAWYARKLNVQGIPTATGGTTPRRMGDARGTRVSQILNRASRYPGDDLPDFHPRRNNYRGQRFHAFLSGFRGDVYIVEDALYGIRWPLHTALLDEPRFDVYRWCCKQLVKLLRECLKWDLWEARSVFGRSFPS